MSISQLIEHVHPPAWQQPRAVAKDDIVVLGGGTAGLVCAMGAAGLGAASRWSNVTGSAATA